MSRVRSAYEIERDALATAKARHRAVVARVDRAAKQYRAQELDVAQSIPAVSDIRSMSSGQVTQEVARLEAALAACGRSATAELERRCQDAFDAAFAAAASQIASEDAGPLLADQRIARRSRSDQTDARDSPSATSSNRAQQVRREIETAQDTVARILARMDPGVTPTDRARIEELASMVGEVSGAGQADRVVLTLRAAVRDANDEVGHAAARSQQLDQWIERLHHLDSAAASGIETRVASLDPAERWASGMADAIERDLEAAERDDARHRALAAARAALSSMGYEVGDEFIHEAPVAAGSLVSIPEQHEHRLRVRESRGSLLMDVVRVSGHHSQADDAVAEATFCSVVPDLAEQARRNGVKLVVSAEDPAGELDYVELDLPATADTDNSSASQRRASSRSNRPRSAERDRRR